MDLEFENHYLLHLDKRAFMEYHEGWVYTRYLEHSEYSYTRPVVYRMHPDGTKKQKIGNLPFFASVYSDGWIYYIPESV